MRSLVNAVKTHLGYERACAKIAEFCEEATTINKEMGIDANLLVSDSNTNTTTRSPCEARKSSKYHDPPVSQCKVEAPG